MKVFYIDVWGAGTPEYLVCAETKERAWELVQAEWRKTYDGWNVGADYYHRDRAQTIDDLIEVKDFIPYLNDSKEVILNLRSYLK